jgi:hypothetical protein
MGVPVHMQQAEPVIEQEATVCASLQHAIHTASTYFVTGRSLKTSAPSNDQMVVRSSDGEVDRIRLISVAADRQGTAHRDDVYLEVTRAEPGLRTCRGAFA